MRGLTVQRITPKFQTRWLTESLSELLCTFLLALFVYASGAQSVLTHGEASSAPGRALAGGAGLMIAVYAGIHASGASANPNVSLMFCLLGKLSWRKLPHYIVAEMVGAFLAAAVTYSVYGDLIDAYDNGVRAISGSNSTAQLFTSFPHPAIGKTTGFFDIVVGTSLLTGSIAAISDKHNANPSPGVTPLAMVFMLFGIVTTFGVNTGAAINIAIDFSGRCLAATVYGAEVFSANDYWFWVPLVAGPTGAIIASFVYQVMVGNHLIHEYVPASAATHLVKEEKQNVDLRAYKSSISVISSDTLISELPS